MHSDDYVYAWEIFGHLAVRKGDWKLLRLSSNPAEARQAGTQDADYWGLYDMKTDPGESNNLAEEMPDKVQELLITWEQYSEENNLVIPIVD